MDYLKTILWYPLMTASVALGVRSLAGALGGLLQKRTAVVPNQGRSVALAVVLLMCAVANPDPVVNQHGLFVSLYTWKLAVSAVKASGLDVPLAPGAGWLALATACAALAFAAVSALAEDALRSQNRGHGPSAGHVLASVWSAWPMASAVDRKRDTSWSLLASITLAALSLAQSASPAVPLVIAAASIVIRSVSALAFIATESPTTKRFALIPARPGAVDRAYFLADLALTALVVAPLAAAGLVLMYRSSR
ncbi:MAG TPA: hypothetical protein VMX33_05400 [bacterium]|nr:hypothetical protein [bacterium]